MPVKKAAKTAPKKEAARKPARPDKKEIPVKKNKENKNALPEDKFFCSFCGEHADQTRKLIAGPNDIFICDECVEVCLRILTEEGGGQYCPLITLKTGRVMQEIGSQLNIAPNQRTRSKYDILYLSPKNTLSDKIYNTLVLPIAEKQKIKVKHIQEIINTKQSFDKELLDIYNSMLIIADIHGQDPNIMHLLGMIHLIDKPLILLTQKQEDVPLSLDKNKIIIYGSTEKSLSELQPQIQQIFLAVKKSRK